MSEVINATRKDTARHFKLGELGRSGQRTGYDAPFLTGFNLGNRTITMTMGMEDFRRFSDVANEARIIEQHGDTTKIAQRPLDTDHAKGIGRYILRGLLVAVGTRWREENRESEDLDELIRELGAGPYQGLQPITANIRDCEPGGTDLDISDKDGQMLVHLRQGQVLMVIDGQHRRVGYGLLSEWLANIVSTGRYIKPRAGGMFIPADRIDDLELTAAEQEVWSAVYQEAKSHCTVEIIAHLGLTIGQERQLFHDLNNRVKKVDASIAQAFDQANPISIFIREVLESEKLLGKARVVESAGGKKSGSSQELVASGAVMRDDIAIANGLLFAGATSTTDIQNSLVMPHYDYGRRFWSAISGQPHFGEPGWQQHTLLAQPTTIKALAGLAFLFHDSREKNHELRDKFLGALENQLLDFSNKNALWRAYLLSDEERSQRFPGIEKYVTPDSVRGAYATWDDATSSLKYATNTRDVMRYIADLIRWKLELPPRAGLIHACRKWVTQGKISADHPILAETKSEE